MLRFLAVASLDLNPDLFFEIHSMLLVSLANVTLSGVALPRHRVMLVGSYQLLSITVGEFNQLFVGWYFFNAMFEFEGIAPGHWVAESQQLDGSAGSGVFGAFAKIVGSQSLIQVVGDPAIQGIIRTSNQVNEPIIIRFQRSTRSFNLVSWVHRVMFH
jgi:hypothetical protein